MTILSIFTLYSSKKGFKKLLHNCRILLGDKEDGTRQQASNMFLKNGNTLTVDYQVKLLAPYTKQKVKMQCSTSKLQKVLDLMSILVVSIVILWI